MPQQRQVMRFTVPDGEPDVGRVQILIEDFLVGGWCRRSAGNDHDPSFFVQAEDDRDDDKLTELQAWLAAEHPQIEWSWVDESSSIKWY